MKFTQGAAGHAEGGGVRVSGAHRVGSEPSMHAFDSSHRLIWHHEVAQGDGPGVRAAHREEPERFADLEPLLLHAGAARRDEAGHDISGIVRSASRHEHHDISDIPRCHPVKGSIEHPAAIDPSRDRVRWASTSKMREGDRRQEPARLHSAEPATLELFDERRAIGGHRLRQASKRRLVLDPAEPGRGVGRRDQFRELALCLAIEWRSEKSCIGKRIDRRSLDPTLVDEFGSGGDCRRDEGGGVR